MLASINRIETAFGTNTSVSTAGALGWMQFIPSTWQMYGVDANNDGRKDPYNPVDAICAAARYLKAAGGETDLRTAIFAYNHADWYVDEVLLYANQYERLPADLVGSLTGLTEGARFPVAADSRYADDITERRLLERVQNGQTVGAEVSDVGRLVAEAARGRRLRRRGLPGARGQRRRDREDRPLATSSATTSSSRTPTATTTPTPSSAAGPRSTRRRARAGRWRPTTSCPTRPTTEDLGRRTAVR